MFGLTKVKNTYGKEAEALYFLSIEAARHPQFYERYDVPDDLDGHFDLLMIHIFMILNRLLDVSPAEQAKELSQDLFDETFKQMDQNLREMGFGDMGVPKQIKKMMVAFNGRMHAYKEALEAGRLEEAIERNIYRKAGQPNPDGVKAIALYMQTHIKSLSGLDFSAIAKADFTFGSIKP